MIDSGDFQLFSLYLLIALATLGFFPGSPCAKEDHPGRSSVAGTLQVLLILAGVTAFLAPYGMWIAAMMILHAVFAGYVAWGKWRAWALAWIAQSAVLYGWMILNPARPVVEAFIE